MRDMTKFCVRWRQRTVLRLIFLTCHYRYISFYKKFFSIVQCTFWKSTFLNLIRAVHLNNPYRKFGAIKKPIKQNFIFPREKSLPYNKMTMLQSFWTKQLMYDKWIRTCDSSSSSSCTFKLRWILLRKMFAIIIKKSKQVQNHQSVLSQKRCW